jgi:hypothetical protein
MLEGEDERAATTPRSSYLVPLALAWTILAFIAVMLSVGFLLVRQDHSRDALGWILSVTLVFLPAYGLVRQLGLAFIIAISVQGGALVASATMALAGLAGRELSLALPVVLVIAFLAAEAFVECLRSGEARPEAALQAIGALLRPAGSGLVMAVSVGSFVGLASGLLDRQHLIALVLQLLIAAAFVLVTVPMAASRISYDEVFLTRASRARERHMTLAYPLSFVAVDRWGLSVAGIWSVFAMLAAFGAQPAIGATTATAASWGAAALPIFGCAILTTEEWRGAVACFLAEVVVALAGLWAVSRLGTFNAAAAFAWVEAISASFVLVMAVAARARHARAEEDDEVAVARLRSIEDLTGVAAFAALGCIVLQIALVPLVEVLIGAVVACSGLVAALVFAPALTTAISWLLPRRRSLSELYGKQ